MTLLGCGSAGCAATALWIVFAFLMGSLPLSVWLGRLGLGLDIRQYGDGNPGAANVWRAAGPRWGLLSVLLDFLKGFLPVGLANYLFGLEGLALAAVALAPILGHAFSPFLRFNGGKALAVTFGIWAGLTLWLAPVILGILFGLFLAILRPEGWAVLAGSLSLLPVLLLLEANVVWLVVWAGMALILAWTHRADLSRPPRLRTLPGRHSS
jgi:glycerol-3-phosphate acyltransferase PlsY